MNKLYTVNADYALCVKVSQATDKRAWLLLLCWKTHFISAADVENGKVLHLYWFTESIHFYGYFMQKKRLINLS